jgi:hypothetical protein
MALNSDRPAPSTATISPSITAARQRSLPAGVDANHLPCSSLGDKSRSASVRRIARFGSSMLCHRQFI